MPRATRFTPRFSSSTTTGARAISVGSCGVRGRSTAYAAAPDSAPASSLAAKTKTIVFATPSRTRATPATRRTRRAACSTRSFASSVARPRRETTSGCACDRTRRATSRRAESPRLYTPKKWGGARSKSRMEKRVSPLRVRRVRRAKKKKKRAADMTCRIPTRRDYSGERACTSTRRAGVLSEHCAPRRRRTSRFSTRDIFNAARRRARERRSGRVGIRRTTRTRRLISDAKRTRTSRSEERHTRTRATRAMAMRARSSV